MTPDDLIGVPWAPGGRDPASGLDCWGVVRACLPGIPDWDISPSDALAVARAFRASRADPQWAAVSEPSDLCVVTLGFPAPAPHSHAGVWWRGGVVHATPQGVRRDLPSDLAYSGFPCLRFYRWTPA